MDRQPSIASYGAKPGMDGRKGLPRDGRAPHWFWIDQSRGRPREDRGKTQTHSPNAVNKLVEVAATIPVPILVNVTPRRNRVARALAAHQ